MSFPIAILGAGPSGLLLARLLEQEGIEYTVFERESLHSAAGALSGTLDLHEGTGQLALREAGLFEQFRAKARYETPIKMADMHGNIILSFAMDVETTRPEIDRVDLRQMLLDSVPAEKVQWSRKVASITKEEDGLMAVHFANHETLRGFQLVVAADGLWSKARRLVTDAIPHYSGFHYLTTKLTQLSPCYSEAQQLIGKGAYLAIGNGKQISAQRLGDGSYYIAIGLRLSEHWSADNATLAQDPNALRIHLLDHEFADWPEAHTSLIKHSNKAFRAWPLYAMPPESMSWKSVPGVALIGDAAHVTTPFVGEGVNCSMYDSVQLAKQIAKHGMSHLDAAVEAYEQEMFPRAVDLITRSQKSGDLMFAADAPAGFLAFLQSQA